MFEIQNTLSFNKDELVPGNEYDYITRTSQNQGILQETGFVNKENINSAGSWSLGLLQMDFFYRNKPWYAGQFVRKIIPKFETNTKLVNFFSTILNKQKDKLLSMLVRDIDKTFLNLKISLPTKKENFGCVNNDFCGDNHSCRDTLQCVSTTIDTNTNTNSYVENKTNDKNISKIDFEFMESFIEDLANERINELNNYLEITGLKDYNLTNEEEKVLEDFESGKFEWGEFEIEKLFNISRGNISNQKDLIKDNSGIVFIAQNDNDNGFVDIVKAENHKQFKGNSLIVGRQTGIVYYQEKDFITTDGVLVLSAKEYFIKNRKIGLLFTSSLTKQMFSFSYTNTVSAEKLNKILIQLPTNKKEPDYKIMEIFISAVQKLVIKDVVEYVERKIEGTRKVVGM